MTEATEATEKAAREAMRAWLSQRAATGATFEELERDLAEHAFNEPVLSVEDYEELWFYAWALTKQATAPWPTFVKRQAG
jgi:hypothetical protein